jgi:nitrogen fixation/metabolism regulation signal transduction histidine kinase
MDNVLEKLKKLRIENEKQAQYLNAIVENITIGLITLDENDNLEIINRTARKILGIGNIKHISKLAHVQPEFFNAITNSAIINRKVIKVEYKGEHLPVSFITGEYRFMGRRMRIITFQNIKNELEEKELESWQNLIRVLTHEIMNSISPMTSTIDTLTELIKENRQNGEILLGEELTGDIEKGIRIIKDRSVGIHDFIRRFRSITLLPKLNRSDISIANLFEHVSILLHEKLRLENIQMHIEIFPSTLILNADKALIEQVLINIVQNSIDAMQNNSHKLISLKAFKGLDNQIIIELADNGPGIENSLLDKIFIPFFTTKENGSGIGLSLARQIMRQHNGKINVYSKPNERTIFELLFL